MSAVTKRSMVLCAIVLAAGVASMMVLISLRKAPAEATAPVEERTMRVTAIAAVPQDVVVNISGYGEVRPRRTVEIAPEVSGTVIEVHPDLVAGGLVDEGEVLFALDPRTHRTALAETEAEIARWQVAQRRVETEWENDRARLKTLSRSRDLAKTKFDRALELLAQSIGNQSQVDEAEEAHNNATDRVDQLERKNAVHKIALEELKQNMVAEEARRDRALLNLQLTKTVAPFDARISSVDLEQGHFATRGVPVLTLADDSSLEIPVKLDASEARDWLRFSGNGKPSDRAWFTNLAEAACTVRWTDGNAQQSWQGTLDRVESFDPESRTLNVVVSIPARSAHGQSEHNFPLVAGMFCEVSIPGRTMRDVYALPQVAVSVDDTIALAKENRLTTEHVHVLRIEDDTVYIQGPINPSDLLITTRLINPLENTLLDVVLEGASE